MKYKNIEKEYLILCLDRLTRFKPSEEKYLRVFRDIFGKYCITKEQSDLKTIKETVVEIFNNSLLNLGASEHDLYINHFLTFEERRLFYQTQESEFLLNNSLNIEGLLNLIENEDNLPQNLKALIKIKNNKNKNAQELREEFSLKFPIEKLILSEGATEVILLGEFTRQNGFDFNKKGFEIIGAGGKNQVARKYYRIIEEIKIPVYILLDKDAKETMELILPKLRAQDKIHLISTGEFEDIIPKDIITEALNFSYKNIAHFTQDDFSKELTTVQNLKEIYKIKGLGDFSKSEFAKNVNTYLRQVEGISGNFDNIINEIKSF